MHVNRKAQGLKSEAEKIGMATDGAELLVVVKKVCNETGAKG